MQKKELTDNLVVKSNELIRASYAMTVNEQRLFLACISQIDSRFTLDNCAKFTLAVEQARDLFYSRGDQRNAYRDLQDASERLFERKVRISLSDNKELLTRFVQSVLFDTDAGQVTLHFATEIIPYLSQLEQNFTRYRLQNVVQLTSSYAIRLYELIVSWAGQSCFYKEIEIDELRELLALGRKYKQFGEFKNYVINPAIEQINESTDFNIDIAFRKSKRTFKWVQLRFNRKENAVTAEEERKTASEKRRILNEGAKMKRLAKEAHTRTEIAQNDALDNFKGLSDGMKFKDTNGDLWLVEAVSGVLYCPTKRIVMPKLQAAQRIASGYFTQVDDVIEEK